VTEAPCTDAPPPLKAPKQEEGKERRRGRESSRSGGGGAVLAGHRKFGQRKPSRDDQILHQKPGPTRRWGGPKRCAGPKRILQLWLNP